MLDDFYDFRSYVNSNCPRRRGGQLLVRLPYYVASVCRGNKTKTQTSHRLRNAPYFYPVKLKIIWGIVNIDHFGFHKAVSSMNAFEQVSDSWWVHAFVLPFRSWLLGLTVPSALSLNDVLFEFMQNTGVLNMWKGVCKNGAKVFWMWIHQFITIIIFTIFSHL